MSEEGNLSENNEVDNTEEILNNEEMLEVLSDNLNNQIQGELVES